MLKSSFFLLFQVSVKLYIIIVVTCNVMYASYFLMHILILFKLESFGMKHKEMRQLKWIKSPAKQLPTRLLSFYFYDMIMVLIFPSRSLMSFWYKIKTSYVVFWHFSFSYLCDLCIRQDMRASLIFHWLRLWIYIFHLIFLYF